MEKLFKSVSEALFLTRKLEDERKGKKGFTLAELLVAVVIITLLAMIAIQQFDKYKKRSAAAGLQSDARNCVTDAVSQITSLQIIGATIPSTGTYSNTSSNTQSCFWNYNSAANSTACTCDGKNILSGVRCCAVLSITGTEVKCGGL
jgi:prepilin-type N-terminal cleavage/methylation domain-containing protein